MVSIHHITHSQRLLSRRQNTAYLERPVVALVAYPHEHVWTHVGVADDALAVT
jgi:hypothetical protein